jgi:hypothetical protein
LASQIPIFEGSEKENVERWLSRVAHVGNLYEVAEDVLLLAATSRFAGEASKWYARQSNEIISSWAVKDKLLKFFGHKTPFTVVMQKITSRNWEAGKEKFIEYANDKLDLMQSLNVPEKDQINMLATGIRDLNLRAVALTVVDESLEQFLDRMRIITEEIGHNRVAQSNTYKPALQRFNIGVIKCSNCQKKGHLAKDCRGKVTCYKCNKEGHISTQCPLRATSFRVAAARPEVAAIARGKTEHQVPHVSIKTLGVVLRNKGGDGFG